MILEETALLRGDFGLASSLREKQCWICAGLVCWRLLCSESEQFHVVDRHRYTYPYRMEVFRRRGMEVLVSIGRRGSSRMRFVPYQPGRQIHQGLDQRCGL